MYVYIKLQKREGEQNGKNDKCNDIEGLNHYDFFIFFK